MLFQTWLARMCYTCCAGETMLRPCERRHCCFHVRASHAAERDAQQWKAYLIHWSNDVEGDRFF
jgi:hypothetical protein